MFPLQFFFGFSPRITVAVVLISGLLVFSGLFIYEEYALPLRVYVASAATNVPAGTVYPSPSAQAAVVAPQAQVPMLEMHIANNGLVLLRGARVVSISGSTMEVSMSWGSNTFVWNVSTANNTEFFAATGAKETLADVKIGDVVTITGMLSGGGQPAVAATIVHD